jgi:5'-3' exonuclease
VHEDEAWKNIEIIFSNEKAPGEGEHKIINYIRFYGKKEDTYCIHGLDADLIMLALGTHLPNFYILREDLYDAANDFFCVDIGKIHGKLGDIMKWESDKFEFSYRSSIDDFIFMCFMVGNDFLPHIPSIEIIEDGIELMINIYKQVCSSYGHLTNNVNDRVRFIPKTVGVFMETIGFSEKENFERKLAKKGCFFPDPLLEKCSIQEENKWTVDIEKYKNCYCKTNIKEESIEKVCHEYLEGMQWVLSYYTRGVPHWKWHYTEHYAPPASILSQHIKTFEFSTYSTTTPSTPFQQLLCVLPPQNANLIPKPLSNLLTNDVSPLKKHCPDVVEIDLAGKRKEWEGIVLLPMVDFNLVRTEYLKLIDQVSAIDIKRNIIGRSFLYEKVHKYPYVFRSYYGNIENCMIKTSLIDL